MGYPDSYTPHMPAGRHAALLECGPASGALSLWAPSLLTCQEWWVPRVPRAAREGPGVFEGIIVLLAKASHTAKPGVTMGGDGREWVQGGEALWVFSVNKALHPPYLFGRYHGEICMGPSLDWQQLPKSARHGRS